MLLRRLGLLCAMLAMFFIAGGHWTVLQTVAWAEMLHDYSQRTGSLAAAVGQTFDGQHPCSLCRDIQAAKARQGKEAPAVPGAKAIAKVKALVADTVSGSPEPVAGEAAFTQAASASGPSRSDQPPTPPPRVG